MNSITQREEKTHPSAAPGSVGTGTMPEKRGLFRYRDGVLPNSIALGYAVGGYVGALALLAQGPAPLWPLAVVWLAHTLLIAAYLIHECAHGTLFRRNRLHDRLAGLLSWITGACYGTTAAIRKKHIRHHLERADIVAIDPRSMLASRPRLRTVVLWSQRLGLPAMELLMHALVLCYPFRRGGSRSTRRRVLTVLLLRSAYFAALASFGWQVLAGYVLAYLLFLHGLALMDAFQHTYPVRVSLDTPRRRPELSLEEEEANTYSNLLSRRFPALNLLVLNFCYHNVHHQQPNIPWHRLPALHRARYGDGRCPEIPLTEQLFRYFRDRVARCAPNPPVRTGDDPGAAGVSFLTPL